MIIDMVPTEMEYGVIYVFTNLYTPPALLNDYIASAGQASGQAEALQRFEVKVKYVDTPPMLMARRFNAGNIGKAAVITSPVCGDMNIDMHLIEEFVGRLFDFSDVDNGDLHLRLDDFLTPEQKVQWQNQLERPDIGAKLEHARLHAESAANLAERPTTIDPEERDLNEAERLRKQMLNVVGQLVVNYVSLTHSDPHQLLGDTLRDTPIVFATQRLSQLTIDSDLHLRLSTFGNAEIPLHPLSKALSILFLLHPEGIELNRIDEHRQELEQIYNIIMPVRDDEATERIIGNVLNPLTGTLNQNLSRIKRFFRTVIIDDTVARQYYITGKRGQAYGITLPRHLVTMPGAFVGLH